MLRSTSLELENRWAMKDSAVEHRFGSSKYRYRFLHALKPVVFELQSMVGRLLSPRRRKAGFPLIHIGCGQTYLDGFLNLDFYDFGASGGKSVGHDIRFPLPFEDQAFEGAFTEHTLEHLDSKDAIAFLHDVHRILKPGSVFRISVPSLLLYVRRYNGELPDPEFAKFENGCAAIWNVTQNWGHQSCWDAEMLISKLMDAGFRSASETSFRSGQDSRLLNDRDERRWESLYIEAIA
jgi:predicted SAM-dependent methyltransferase